MSYNFRIMLIMILGVSYFLIYYLYKLFSEVYNRKMIFLLIAGMILISYGVLCIFKKEAIEFGTIIISPTFGISVLISVLIRNYDNKVNDK